MPLKLKSMDQNGGICITNNSLNEKETHDIRNSVGVHNIIVLPTYRLLPFCTAVVKIPQETGQFLKMIIVGELCSIVFGVSTIHVHVRESQIQCNTAYVDNDNATHYIHHVHVDRNG